MSGAAGMGLRPASGGGRGSLISSGWSACCPVTSPSVPVPDPPSERARRPYLSWRLPSAPHKGRWHEQSKVFPSDWYPPPGVKRGGTEKAFGGMCTRPGGRERPAVWLRRESWRRLWLHFLPAFRFCDHVNTSAIHKN